MSNLIQINNLNKSFDTFKKIKVLKKISYKFKKGKIYSLMGPSGSGKSTLLHIAGLLDSADSGDVLIDNFLDSKIANLRYANQIRLDNMGFIYQYHHLLKDFTAQENVAMPLLINSVPKKEAIEKAASILEELGLGKRLYNVPGELSGGEQQRVALLRALAPNPSVMFLDEPFSSLDTKLRIQVRDDAIKILKDRGVATVFVTHDFEEAMLTADRIILMKEGKIIQSTL